MSDQTKSVLDNMEDLELITSWLNGQLDPERVEAVRKRLEEDAAFRELAAPLLLTWSVPPHLGRKPRPEGEWQRDWTEFTRRAGFDESGAVPKPRRRWHSVRRWLAVVAVVIGAYGIYGLFGATRNAIVEYRRSLLVPYDTGWIALGDGIEVQLSHGTSLHAGLDDVNSKRRFWLDGLARFRVSPNYSRQPSLRLNVLLVDTRAGSVTAGESEFVVSARGDTTMVFVNPLGPRRALAPELRTVYAATELPDGTHIVTLFDREGARLVRGRVPQPSTNHSSR